MQEAFRKALHDVDAQDTGAPLDPRTRVLIQAAGRDPDAQAPDEASAPAAPGQIQKLRYLMRKLASRWNAFSKAAAITAARPAPLAQLQSDWLIFRTYLAKLPHTQRSQLLEELGEALELSDPRQVTWRLAYLKQAARAKPEHFVGLDTIPDAPWPGPLTFFIHTIAELAAASAEERRLLHRFLAQRAGEQSFALGEELATWLFAPASIHTMEQAMGHELAREPAA